jgi:hypothetical protein
LEILVSLGSLGISEAIWPAGREKPAFESEDGSAEAE